jgi:hypothetical protein
MRTAPTLVAFVLFAAPTLAVRAERPGPPVTPAQLWRVPSLSLEQRRRIADALGPLRGGGRRAADVRDALARIEAVAAPTQLDEARRNAREPLVAEELLYYPILSLPDLDAGRRAKVEAVFAPAIADARAAGSRAADARGELRPRRLALFEVLDALLTPDQIVAARQFLPEQIRSRGLRERVVVRLPSLTLEQEARARAIFAALEDETAADRARLKAMKDGPSPERREVAERVTARERQANDELATVLSAEQMKELATQKPGPPRPLVFTPGAVRGLGDITPDQRRRIADAYRAFMVSTRDERTEARTLGKQAKDADLLSPESAGVRDRLRQAARVLDVERDRLVRTIADTLTPSQLATLVEAASRAPSRLGRPGKGDASSGGAPAPQPGEANDLRRPRRHSV